MKFVFLKVAETIRHIPGTLRAMGHEVDEFEDYKFGIKQLDKEDERFRKLRCMLKKNKYDYAISFDFFEEVSDLCAECDTLYIAWAFDSPLMSLFQPAAKNPNNIIFSMDKMQQKHLSKHGIDTEYMPLAGNPDIASGLEISSADETLFGWDISFVGGMYERNTYNMSAQWLPAGIKNEFDSYLMDNLCKWNNCRCWPKVSSEAADIYRQVDENVANQSGFMSYEEYFGINLLSRKLAEMERLTALNRLSEIHEVTVFTTSNTPFLSSIKGHVFPSVDYLTDMYKIFHLSRINLNLTLPSIESGIPLRVYDIMSVGGFCLTNYQEEIEDLFEIGKDLEVFHDLEELADKCKYYLSHEQERLKIAVQGYMTVKNRHTFRHRLERILEIADKKRKTI